MNKLLHRIVEDQNHQNYFLFFNKIPVDIHHDLEPVVDVKSVLNKIENLIPRAIISDIDSIQVGDFSFLSTRDVSALYDDEKNTLYISSLEQDDTVDLLDDLVHEMAHAVEDSFGDFIYKDGKVEREFLIKRLAMEKSLRAHDFNIEGYDFMNTNYDSNFDSFLYKEITYDVLRPHTEGLFCSPYGATSLREYFANSFEEYYLGDNSYVAKVCPKVFNKINKLHFAGEKHEN
jgi:hypothetical protein